MGKETQRSGEGACYEAADWCGPSASFRSAPSLAGAASKPVPPRRVALVRDPYHTRARAAGLDVERDRARAVVGAARTAVTATFDDIRFGRRIDMAALQPVVAGIAASISRHPAALPSVTRLKQVHEYTYLHSVAVCGLMIGLARELDLPDELTHDIGLAGLLHDIGKATVPVALLDKPGPLDLDEYALVQRHTIRGRELLEDSGVTSDIALDVCLHHHERADGAGYPLGIALPAISLHARMGAVCDVYDAVTSRRSYKNSWSPGEALEWMTGTTGQFDPRVLQAFRRMIGLFPVGSLVRLESQRLALVVDDGEAAGSPPVVCVVMCAATRRSLVPVRTSTVHDRILGLELSTRWPLDNWKGQRAAILAEHAVP